MTFGKRKEEPKFRPCEICHGRGWLDDEIGKRLAEAPIDAIDSCWRCHGTGEIKNKRSAKEIEASRRRTRANFARQMERLSEAYAKEFGVDRQIADEAFGLRRLK